MVKHTMFRAIEVEMLLLLITLLEAWCLTSWYRRRLRNWW